MNNKIALSSLALDLRRVAQGYHRGSGMMATRFLDEALKRVDEVDSTALKPYINVLLNKVKNLQEIHDNNDKAEQALMLSTLFQNAALELLKG